VVVFGCGEGLGELIEEVEKGSEGRVEREALYVLKLMSCEAGL